MLKKTYVIYVIPPSPASAAPQPPSFPFPFPSPGWRVAMVTNSGLPSGWGFSCIPWASEGFPALRTWQWIQLLRLPCMAEYKYVHIYMCIHIYMILYVYIFISIDYIRLLYDITVLLFQRPKWSILVNVIPKKKQSRWLVCSASFYGIISCPLMVMVNSPCFATWATVNPELTRHLRAFQWSKSRSTIFGMFVAAFRQPNYSCVFECCSRYSGETTSYVLSASPALLAAISSIKFISLPFLMRFQPGLVSPSVLGMR